MIKKLLILFITLIISYATFDLLNPTYANAQGACSCGHPPSQPNLCAVSSDSCAIGYSARCTGRTTSCSCRCVATARDIVCPGGINSAIGCIPLASISTVGNYALTFAIGIGGGIAFLLIAYASFMIMTSSGNPERLKAGQELLTSAIAGVILIIFSVYLLRLLGVNIFRLPGFV